MGNIHESTLKQATEWHFNAMQWQALLAEKEAAFATFLTQKEVAFTTALAQKEAEFVAILQEKEALIRRLEELLRLARAHRFGAQSEKNPNQGRLFDEVELVVAFEEWLESFTPPPPKPVMPSRQRAFPAHLPRERIEYRLTEEEKQGALRTFFSKVKEELDYIPARIVILEHWQEKAVFAESAPVVAAEVQAETAETAETNGQNGQAEADVPPAIETLTPAITEREAPTETDTSTPTEMPAEAETRTQITTETDTQTESSVETLTQTETETQADTDTQVETDNRSPFLSRSEHIVAASRPTHPLGKCQVSVRFLVHILISKYADGLPLYRLEGIGKRYGVDVSRSNMARWAIQLAGVVLPILTLIRETQNEGSYLQVDETRIQVLKEQGKSAQSHQWMWVSVSPLSDKPSVLFEYDPSRAGAVPLRLLLDFQGTLQCDGYSGYAALARQQGIDRIGCWDHARRKFVEAIKAAPPSAKGKPSKADIALSKINKLYRIETEIRGKGVDEKYQARQQYSLPILNDLKSWLDENAPKTMKGGKTREAMDYALNQWSTLIGYCQQGYLNISNVRAENAIRPFAVGRKAWLFADTTKGAQASATWYSLIESAKMNHLEPSAYLNYLLERVGEADTLEKWEALLPWNVARLGILKTI